MQGPTQEVTLPDNPPAAGELRSAPWHLAALIACGHTLGAHEFRYDAQNRVWRTWHISPMPVINTGVTPAQGASALIEAVESGLHVADNPRHPYLAAYLGARTYDRLLRYRRTGGEKPLCVLVTRARDWVPVELVFPSEVKDGRQDLAQAALGECLIANVSDFQLAAAMITLGFPLLGLREDGVPRLGALVLNPDASPSRAESVLFPGLTIEACAQAAAGMRKQMAECSREIVASPVPPALDSPLPDGHLFHWAMIGAIRRESLRPLEATLGHDSSPLRSHVFDAPRKGKDGHCVIATAAEYVANEEKIIHHLRTPR